MLDVMRNPPPVAEVIEWKACRVEVPSDGRTVLVWAPEDSGGNNVWLGYYARPDEDDVDEEDDPDDLAEWTNIDGLGRIEVYWWADMPKFPGEPGAQACKFGDPLCPCPDGDPCHYEGKDAWRSKGAAQAPTDDGKAMHDRVSWQAELRVRLEAFWQSSTAAKHRAVEPVIEHINYLRSDASEGWKARAFLASRTDGAAASVQKPALGHQIGASAEKSGSQFLGHQSERSVEIPAAADGDRE